MRIGLWAGQLHALRHQMQTADLVVMPRKHPPKIAIGRVTGPYAHAADQPSPHTRPVHWVRGDIPRPAVQQDLIATFNGLATIFEAKRNNAVARVEALAKSDADPGWVVEFAGTGAAKMPAGGEPDLPRDLDALAKDQIRARIASRFVGHAFTRLIAATSRGRRLPDERVAAWA